MEVFRGGCKSILPSGERTKGRSSTGGGEGIQILNAMAHSANFSDYLCIYKLIISLCEV